MSGRDPVHDDQPHVSATLAAGGFPRSVVVAGGLVWVAPDDRIWRYGRRPAAKARPLRPTRAPAPRPSPKPRLLTKPKPRGRARPRDYFGSLAALTLDPATRLRVAATGLPLTERALEALVGGLAFATDFRIAAGTDNIRSAVAMRNLVDAGLAERFSAPGPGNTRWGYRVTDAGRAEWARFRARGSLADRLLALRLSAWLGVSEMAGVLLARLAATPDLALPHAALAECIRRPGPLKLNGGLPNLVMALRRALAAKGVEDAILRSRGAYRLTQAAASRILEPMVDR